jgi:hypothetical protein
MTPEAFIKSVRRIYARQQKKKTIGPGIYRGTIPSVSPQTEDLFAQYLKEALPGEDGEGPERKIPA